MNFTFLLSKAQATNEVPRYIKKRNNVMIEFQQEDSYLFYLFMIKIFFV